MTAAQRQKQITDKIEEAQRILEDAARLASILRGWCDQWEDIGREVDSVQALWWRIHQAPEPGEPNTI